MKQKLISKNIMKQGGILAGIVILLVLLLFTPQVSSKLFFSLLLLSVVILFSKMFVAGEYGISVTYFLYFGITYAIGPIAGILIALITGAVQVFIATRPTPIDFCIKKDVGTAFRQTIRLVLVSLVVVGLKYFKGPQWIMSHLVLVYITLLIIFWVVMYDVPRLVLGTAPPGKLLILVAVALTINWKLIEIFGAKYIGWLGGLVG